MHHVCVPLVESTTNNESEKIKFPQKNGNDVNSKYPLAEETTAANSDKTGEVSETRPQEIYQESSKACVESKKQTEHQPEGYNIENKILRHTDSEGLVMMEPIPKSSELEDDSTSTLSELAINQGEKAGKSILKVTYKEEESTATDNDQSCKPQNELEQTSKALEAIDQTQSVGKDTAENECTNNQSEAPSMENVTTKHSNSGGKLTMESSIKSSYNMEAIETISESYSVDNQVVKDGGRIIPEKAADIKEATEVELEKSETESVPEDKAQSTLPTTASFTVEAVEESIQEEIHKEEESLVTDTGEGHIPQNNFEKNTVPENLDLHKAVSNTCMEDEKKAQNQSKAQSLEAIAITHPNLEGLEKTEIVPMNNTEELEKDPASHNRQKLQMKDGGNIMQEEEKEMGLTEDMKLVISATESAPEDEHKEEESTVTENKKSSRPENELEKMTEVLEATENPKPMAKIDAETEENANLQSQASSMENVIMKHINIEGKDTIESSKTSSYEMDQLEKNPDSHSVNNADIKEAGKIKPEEAIDIKVTTNMESQNTATESAPADKPLSTVHNTASVGVETAEESIQQGKQKEEESAVTDTKEGQRPENDFEETKNVPEATDQPETILRVDAENKEQGDHQSEALSMESMITNHVNTEGKVRSESRTKSSYDVDKLEDIPESQLVVNTEITEGVPECKAQQIPNTASVNIEEVDDNIQEEIYMEAESAVTDTQGQIRENDFEAFGLQEMTQQTSVESELKAESQSEAQNQETIFIKHLNLEGETTEITPTNETEEQEKGPASHSMEKLEINNNGKFTQEEASEIQSPKTAPESVLEVKALETLSTTTYYGAEAFDKSIQEEIHTKEEIEVNTAKEGQPPENYFEDKMKVPKAFGLEQVTHKTSGENLVKAELQFEVLNQETTIIKHPNLEGETAEINLTNDTEEKENIPESHTGVKLENENDDGKFIQDKAKETEGATEMQLLKSATESLLEDEVQSTVPTSTIVEDDTEEILQQQTLHNEETAKIDGDKSYKEENEFEKTANVVEVIDQSKTMAKVIPENEEQAEHQSEGSSIQSVITKHINEELIVTSESSTKTIYVADELQIVDSHLVEDLETKYGCKITAEEATNTKQLTGVEIQKSETTKSEPDDKALQAFNTTSARIDAFDRSLEEEIHTEAEIAVTDTTQGQMLDNDFENKKNIPEGFDLHEVTCQSSAENELKAEPQSEAQNQGKSFIKHQTLEGETPEINPTNNTEEHDMVPVSHNGETLESKDDDGKFIKEETEEMQEAREFQLIKTATESLPPEDEVLSTLPTSAVVKGDNEQILQQQTLYDDEAAAINNKNCRHENEHEKLSNIKVGEENEEHANRQTEATSMITEHIKAEGIVTFESSTKSSCYADKPENMVKSNSVQNFESKEGSSTSTEEVTDTKQSTKAQIQNCETESVPKNKAPQTLPNIAFVNIEAVVGSIQEKRLAEAELSVTDIEEQMPKNDFQAFGLHDVTCQPSAENELKAEPISEVHNQVTLIKQANLEGETTEINPTNNTEEWEKVTASQIREKLEIEDDGKFIQDKEKQMDEETEMQLLKTAAESVPSDEVQSTLPTTAIVKSDTEEILWQQTLDEDKLAAIDNNKSSKQENEDEKTVDVVEANDPPKIMAHVSSENKELADHQSEASSMQSLITKYIDAEGAVTSQSSTKSSYDADELEKIEDPYMVKNFDNKYGHKIITKEITGVPQDNILQASPNTASISIEAVEESIQEEIHTEVETKERQIQDNDFEALDLHEVTSQHNVEKELKAEPQSEVQNQEMTFIKHWCLERQTTERNPTNDTGEQEEVPALIREEKLAIDEDGKLIQEEAKGLPEDVSQSTLPTSAIVDIEQILQQQAIHNDKSAAIDNEKSSKEENELQKASNVVEAFDQTKIMANVSAVKEEKADHESKASSMQSAITKYINAEGIETLESTAKSSYNATEQKTIDSHLSENLERKNGSKRGADDESNQEEIQRDAEIAGIHTKEGQISEYYFDAKNDMMEAYGLQEVTRQLSAEKELNNESQPETKNKEITFTKHPNSDDGTTEANPTHDTDEQEMVSVPHTEDKLGIEDDGKFIQEEANRIEEAIKLESLKVATESPPEDEVQSTLATSATVQGDTEIIIQQENFNDDESAVIDVERSFRQEIELEKLSDVVEVTDEPKTMAIIGTVKEDQADHQSEASTTQCVITKQINEEGIGTPESSTKSGYNADEQEKTTGLYSVNNLANTDGNDIMAEEAADSKQLTDLEIQKSEIESLPADEVQSTLPTSAIVQGDTEQIIQQQTLHYDAPAVIDADKSFKQETEPEKTSDVVEEEQADHQSEASTTQCGITKHINAEGIVTSKSSTKSGYNREEQEKTTDSHSVKNLDSPDGNEITEEEAAETKQLTDLEIQKSEIESLPEDKVLQTLTNAALVSNEAAHKKNQEEIQRQAEFAVTHTKEEQIPETVFVKQVSGLQEVKQQLGSENELKCESQSETQNQETTIIKQPDFEGGTTEISPTNDTEEQEKVSGSYTAKLPIEVDGKLTQEEERGIEEATKVQSLKTATESLPEHEVQSTPATSTIIQGENEPIIHQKTSHDYESALMNEENFIQEIELEKTSNVVEVTDELETIANIGTIKEEQADHESEASSTQCVITKHINTKGIVTSESSTKSGCNADKQEKTTDSHSVKNLESMDGSKITEEEAADTKQLTDVEIQKSESESESLPEDNAEQILPDAALINNEAVDKRDQEKIQRHVEFAVMHSKEGQIPQNDIDGKNNITEASRLQEVTRQLSADNELKTNSEAETQNQETTFIKHSNLDGRTTEINRTNDTDGQEKVSGPHTNQKIPIEDDGKFIQEEEKRIQEATKMQSLETATESLPKHEVQLTPATSTIAQGDTEQIIHQKTSHDYESAVMNVEENFIQEIELEKTSKVVEVTDEPETMANIGAIKEEQADHQSEASITQCVITKHINTEGIVTSESSTKSGCNADKPENTTDSHSVKNLESADGSKITAEEAADTKQLTDVEIQKLANESLPEDKAQQTLPNAPFVSNEAVDKRNEEEIQREVEFAVTHTREGQIPENDIDGKNNITEASGLQEVTQWLCADNELKTKSEAETPKQETTFIKHPNSDGTPTYDTDEQEKVSGPHSDEKLPVEEDEKFVQGEEKAIEDAIKMQSLKIATEDDTDEQEKVSGPQTDEKLPAEEDEKFIRGEEKSIEEAIKMQSLKNATEDDTDEQEKVSGPHIDEKLPVEEDEKFIQGEGKGIEEAIKMQSLKNPTESLPKDEVRSTLPTSTIIQGDTEQIIQQQTLHDHESPVIDVDKSFGEEFELEKTSGIVEVTDETKTMANIAAIKEEQAEVTDETEIMANIGAVKEEQADHQSEASTTQYGITKHIFAEGIVTLESSTKSGYNEDEQEKMVDSDSVKNLESMDGSKITIEEAANTKQLTDVEIQKSETESLPEDRALQTLPNAALVGNEAVDKGNQEEIQREAEFAVTHTKEGQASRLHTLARQLSTENELKTESQPEMQNQETTFIKHPNSDGGTTVINPTNDTDEQEMVSLPHTGEKLRIEDDGKFIQEEVKGIEEATKIKSLRTAIESLPEHEVQSTLSTCAIFQGDTEQIMQQQTLHNDQSAASVNDKSFKQEIELEIISNVVEATDHPETMANISTVKEEQADHQSEAPSTQSVITKYINAEGNATLESCTKSNYNAEEQEKTVDSHLVENLKSKGRCKITAEEVTDAKQLTDVEIQKSETGSVPEDKALQTLTNEALVSNQAVEESNQEEIQREAEFAVTHTQEEIPKYDSDAKNDITEVCADNNKINLRKKKER